MEEFLSLSETKKINLLTKENLFPPDTQLEIIFDLSEKISRKKRKLLFEQLCSGHLIFSFLEELSKWTEYNIEKKLFLSKILYFIKNRHIKSYLNIQDDVSIDKREINKPEEKTEQAEEQTFKTEDTEIKSQEEKTVRTEDMEISSQGEQNTGISPGTEEQTIQSPPPEMSFRGEQIEENGSMGSTYQPASQKSQTESTEITFPTEQTNQEEILEIISQPDETVHTDEQNLKVRGEEKKLVSKIIKIFTKLKKDKSPDVFFYSARSLAHLASENRFALDYWKELIKNGNPEDEKYALSGIGEFLQSENPELNIYNDALISYLEEEDKNKGLKIIKEKLAIKSDVQMVFLNSFDKIYSLYPSGAEKIFKRDFSLKPDDLNILRSLSMAFDFHNIKNRKIQPLYEIFINSLKEKNFFSKLRISISEEDYAIWELLLRLLREFAYFIPQSREELEKLLNYDLPVYLNFEIILTMIKINMFSNKTFAFDKFKRFLSNDEALTRCAIIKIHMEKLINNQWSYENVSEFRKIIKASGPIFLKDLEDDFHTRIIHNFIIDIKDNVAILARLSDYYNPEEKLIMENIKETFINNYENWLNNLKEIISGKAKPETKHGALQILLYNSKKQNIFEIIKPALNSNDKGICNYLASLLREIFNEYRNDAEKVIKYCRLMLQNGASRYIYESLISSLKLPWLNKLLNIFLEFRKNEISENEKGDAIFLKNLVFLEENILKKTSFKKFCHGLLRFSKCKNIKEIYRELERNELNISSVTLVTDSEFEKYFKSNLDNLKKELKGFYSPDNISDLSNKELKLSAALEITRGILNSIHKKASLLLERPLYSILEKSFSDCSDIIEKAINIIKQLRTDLEFGTVSSIHKNYIILRESEFFDDTNLKNIEKLLINYLIEMNPSEENGKIEVIKFYKDLYLNQPEDKRYDLPLSVFLNGLDIKYIKTADIITSILSDYIIYLDKNKGHQAIIELIYKLFDYGVGKEIFSLLKDHLAKKNGPGHIISLIKAYNEIFDNITQEKVSKLNQLLKDFKNKYNIKINYIETYEIFLELSKSTGKIKTLQATFNKLFKKSKLMNAFYNCLESEANGNQIRKEKIYLKIFQNFSNLAMEIDELIKCDFPEFDNRLNFIGNSMKILEELNIIIGDNLNEPVSKGILCNLFIEKLLTGIEEEVDSDSTFSLKKLSIRWEKLRRLTTLNKIDSITELYHRRDICNYLQIDNINEFKQFVVKKNYEYYNNDKAIYLEYFDRSHKEYKGNHPHPPSPVKDGRTEPFKFPFTLSLLTSVFYFLIISPPVISLINPSWLKIFMGSMLFFFITLSSIFIFLYFIFYITGIDIKAGFLMPNTMNSVFASFIPFLICQFIFMGDGLWKIGVNIDDSCFFLILIFSTLLSFFYLSKNISKKLASEENKRSKVIEASGIIIMFASIQTFILSFVLSTLFSHVFINCKSSGYFLFNLLPREITIFEPFTIYPSVVYTWTFMSLLCSIIVYTFIHKK